MKFNNGLIGIETGKDPMVLWKIANKALSTFKISISKKMSKNRAVRIRQLRIDEDYTWRAVASQSYKDWAGDADWQPDCSQFAGMALCESAAKMFDEDYRKKPWN